MPLETPGGPAAAYALSVIATPLDPSPFRAPDDPANRPADPRRLRRQSWVRELGGPKTLGLRYLSAAETGCTHHFRSRELVLRTTARTRICARTDQAWWSGVESPADRP